MEQPKHNALFNTVSGVVCARRLKETKLMAINEINLFIFEFYAVKISSVYSTEDFYLSFPVSFSKLLTFQFS